MVTNSKPQVAKGTYVQARVPGGRTIDLKANLAVPGRGGQGKTGTQKLG